MKNILIPTTLSPDTVNAVKTAVSQAKQNVCSIVLLLLKDAPEDFSAAASLRNLKYTLTDDQDKILLQCRNIVKATCNCDLKIHSQYGISRPLLRNLIEHLETGLVILTPSFKENKSGINKKLAGLLLQSSHPILHLNAIEVETLTNALYIEHKTSRFTVQDLQQMLNNQFTFRIVSRAKINDDFIAAEATPVIAETITTKQIDVLVETRLVNKKLNKVSRVNSCSLGLPVLSVYEEEICN